MRFTTALLLGSAAARVYGVAIPDTTTTEPALDVEAEVLADADVEEYPVLSFGEDLGEEAAPLEARTTRRCKAIPGDNAWPSSFAWNVLKLFVGGKLVKPAPIGSVCYAGDNYNADQCAAISSDWSNSGLQ
jgi:hypothetical protein